MNQSVAFRRVLLLGFVSYLVNGFASAPQKTPPLLQKLPIRHETLLSNAFTTTKRPKRTTSSIRLYGIQTREESKTVNDQQPENTQETKSQLWFGFPQEVASPLALLLVSQFLLFIGVGAVIPSIPLYGKEIGLSSSANGIVISAPAVALLLGAKWAGNFADSTRKIAMMSGMAVIAISDVGTAFAYTLPTLVLARLGLGIGRCISESGERGMLADLAGQVPELRGRALSAQSVTTALGIAIGAPLGGMVVERYGPRAAFLCVSAAAVVALIVYVFLPETRYMTVAATSNTGPSDKTTDVEEVLLSPTEAVREQTSPTGNNNKDWGDLVSRREWQGLALAQSGATFGFANKIASIPILATSLLPGGATGAGALLSAAGLSGLVGGPIGGWLTDRFSAKTTIVASGLVSTTALVLIPVSLSMLRDSDSDMALAFCALVIMWSLGATAQGPALTARAQELAPKGAEATAMALPRAAGDATYIFAPFLLGLATDALLDTPGIECAVAGVATLAGIVALVLLGETPSKGPRLEEST